MTLLRWARRAPMIALAALAPQLVAQQGGVSQSGAPARADNDKKILNVGDYGRFNRVTSTALSADGKWMSFAYAPNEGDVTLHVKELDGTREHVIPTGSGGAAGGGRGGAGGGGP